MQENPNSKSSSTCFKVMASQKLETSGKCSPTFGSLLECWPRTKRFMNDCFQLESRMPNSSGTKPSMIQTNTWKSTSKTSFTIWWRRTVLTTSGASNGSTASMGTMQAFMIIRRRFDASRPSPKRSANGLKSSWLIIKASITSRTNSSHSESSSLSKSNWKRQRSGVLLCKIILKKRNWMTMT